MFLDRESVDAKVRQPDFPHSYKEYESTWTPDEIVERLKDADIAIINKVPMRAETLKQLPKLKLIAVAATGTDVVDKAYCKANGITVVNIRNYAFNTVPEHVLALIFALRAQSARLYVEDVRAGRWNKSNQFCFFDHPIRDVAGSTLGIVGYGALGKSIAKRAEALGMKVLPYDVFPQPGLVDFETILTESDVITLHVPLTPETKNMIGAKELKKMKPTAILINTARGGLVDEAALAEALKNGTIARRRLRRADQGAAERGQHPARRRRCRISSSRRMSPGRAKEAMQILADQLIDNIEAFVARQAAERRRVKLEGTMTTMKKLLFLFDTDPYASVFDTVVAYDGGADRVTGYANVTPENVGALVDGTIYTRGGKEKQSTAIFVGGGDMAKGEAVLDGGEEALLRPVPRLGDARFERLEHHGGGRRGAARQGDEAQGQEGRGARRHRPGRHARRGVARPGRRRGHHHLAHRRTRPSRRPRRSRPRFGVKVKAVEGADDGDARRGRRRTRKIVFAAGAIGIELPAARSLEGQSDHRARRRCERPAAARHRRHRGDRQGQGAQRQDRVRRARHRRPEAEAAPRLHRPAVRKRRQVLDAEEIYALAKEMA